MKLDMAMDERRQMEEALRESELNAEEAKKIVLNYERARIEDEKVHEAEMRDYKVLIIILIKLDSFNNNIRR